MTSPGVKTGAEVLAEAQIDPAGALSAAEGILGQATAPETVVTARYARGMALRTLHRLPEAQEALQRAADEALAAGLGPLGGRILLSLSGAWAMGGRMDRAFAVADRARDHLEGADLAACEAQTATFLHRQDKHEEAVVRFDTAIATMLRTGVVERLPLAYANRGLALVALGRLADAQKSLKAGWDLVGHDPAQTGFILSHLGWVAAMRGDLVEALARFEQLEHSDLPGRRDPGWLVDYAFALAEAGLLKEATIAARRSLDAAEAAGLRARRQLPLTMLTEFSIRAGDIAQAMEYAGMAATSLEEVGASPLGARLLAAEALLADAPSKEALRHIDDLVAQAAEELLPIDADQAQVAMARAASRLDLLDEAEAMLSHHLFNSAALRVQVEAWTVLADIRLATGNPVGAETALRAALRRANAHRAVFGATDLRAASAELGRRAAQLGLRLAISSRKADRIFVWAERTRAANQRSRPVRPAADVEQAELLSRYRQLADRARKENVATPALRRDAQRLERRIRDRARLVRAQGEDRDAEPSLAVLKSATAGGMFVEFVEVDECFYALVINERRGQLTPFPTARSLEQRLRALDLSVARLLAAPDDRRARVKLDAVLADLDERLVAPWRRQLPDTITISPVGLLHSIPWSALPSLQEYEVAVTPSATSWLRSRRPGTGPPVFVAGPDLVHAESEVNSVAARWPIASTFAATEATADKVLAALDGASLAHISAHGRFRADNPMFSSLQMADGPLSLYDLEELDQPPAIVVLSACEAGSSVVSVGDDMMGLAATFLEMGSGAVIAPLFPVDDEATRLVMERFHSELAAGSSPAAALRVARASEVAAERLAAASFVCFT